jgi:hypothetical protein
MDLGHPDLKYGAEALTLLGIAYRLASWAWRTERELEDPPGVSDDDASWWPGVDGIVDGISEMWRGFIADVRQLVGGRGDNPAALTITMTSSAAAPSPGELGNAPPPATLLDALTPAQRMLVLEQLARDEGRPAGGSEALSPPAR